MLKVISTFRLFYDRFLPNTTIFKNKQWANNIPAMKTKNIHYLSFSILGNKLQKT